MGHKHYFRACGVIVTALISLSCGTTEPSVTEQPKSGSPLPFGHVELPRPGETIRGQWPVQGWALSDSGIKAVEIYVDRTYVGSAQLGVSRPDVQKVYPSIKDSSTAGWTYTLNAAAITPGAHELVVQARSGENRTRDIGTPAITVSR
jgi:hypothetical protein